jgi:hypothetical protein
MVYLMSIVKYPPHIVEDVVKFYVSGEAPAYPEFVKRTHQWVASGYQFKTYNIYEVPDDKIHEAMKGIARRLAAFARFDGYVFKVFHLLEGKEALEMVK